MSTRCNIIIKEHNEQVILYHHHDGYPGGVGCELQEFLTLIADKYYHCEDIANKLIKEGLKIYDNDGNEKYHDDEFEFTTAIHTDIEYLYIINIKYNSNAHKMVYGLSCYDTRYSWSKVVNKEVLRHRFLEEIPDSTNDEYHVKLD